MNAVTVFGVGVTLLGVAGYIAGVSAPYPGRAFSLTALMGGLTILAVGRSATEADP